MATGEHLIFGAKPKPLWARVLRLQYLPAMIIVVLVVLSACFADYQKRRIGEENLRSKVTEQLSLIRANLEGKINGNIQLVQGFVALLEAEPDMSPDQFMLMARRLLENDSQIRNIAAAPDLVISMMYPLKGNEKAIGLDYRTSLRQSPSVYQARDTGKLVIAGPLELVQGGQALIARYPVMAETPLHSQKFWGILSAVIDLQRLYKDSGLLDPDLPISVALASDDAAGQYGMPFFGDGAIFRNRPVETTVALGRDHWRIAATPKSGWHQLPPDIWSFRLMTLLVGLMVIAPMIWAGRLMEERRQNIRTLQQREEQLKAVSHRLDVALETSKIGIWEFDVESGHLLWDDRMRELYGVPPEKVGCDYSDWKGALHPDDAKEAEEAFARTFRKDGNYVSEFRLLTRSGEIRHIRSIGRAYSDLAGGLKLVGVNWNVTADIELQNALRDAKTQADQHNLQLEQARLQMEYNSLHDALTKLPNRRFLDQLLAEKNRQSGGAPQLTILHIDLDRFKDINDTLGHAAGDEILRHAAAVLTEHISGSDFAARIGGDEFVIVSEIVDDGLHYRQLAERIITALSTPILYHGHECRAGASLGIASRAVAGENAEQLLINADIALYEAKRRGRGRCEFFTDTLRSAAINTKQTADEVLRALELNQFLTYFQPQFDANTLDITGVEALVRWDHPTRGIVPPDAFLKIAESLNVVSKIDQIVLEQSLLQSHLWAAKGLNIPKVSVNISAQRLHDPQLFAHLDTLSIRPGTLCFELLESISFDEHDETLISNIRKIKAMGIDIEIDDFGTGYASIISLLKLTPRRLKIDRQLIKPILTSTTERQLVASIIDIGRTCGIEIVAEGVETMEHAERLRDMGCQTLQGYVFARPMNGQDFMQFVEERRWPGAGRLAELPLRYTA